MDSKSILQYFLSFFILLATVESNYVIEESLMEVDCHKSFGFGSILCNEKSPVKEQVSRLGICYPDTQINVAFSNRHHYSYDLNSDTFENFKTRRLAIFDAEVKKFTDEFGEPAFRGQEPYVEIIEIYKSHFNVINKDLCSFGHLRKLETFRLTDTNMESFGDVYFANSLESSVRVLDISRNNINKIGNNAFARLNRLKYMYLRKNNIKMLKGSMMPNPAPYLEHIDIRGNPIEILKSDTFANMPKLEHLLLGGTRVLVIDEATFKPIWSQLSNFIAENVSCEEDDIDWMLNKRHPEMVEATCNGEKGETLEQKIEKLRKKV